MREPVRDKGRLEHMKAAIEHVLDFTKKSQWMICQRTPLNIMALSNA